MNESVLPRGAALRRAVRWLSEQRSESPGANVAVLIEQASIRFDLSPLDENYLLDQLVWSIVPSDHGRTRAVALRSAGSGARASNATLLASSAELDRLLPELPEPGPEQPQQRAHGARGPPSAGARARPDRRRPVVHGEVGAA